MIPKELYDTIESLQTQINDLKNKYEQLRIKINSHINKKDIHEVGLI